MPKITTTQSKKIIVLYFMKMIISTFISIVIFNCISSFIIYKLDMDLSLSKYFSIAVCSVSAIIISLVCTTGFKNNFFLMSLISVTPLAIYTFCNFLVNDTNSIIFLIKLICIILCSIAVSLFKSTRKR